MEQKPSWNRNGQKDFYSPQYDTHDQYVLVCESAKMISITHSHVFFFLVCLVCEHTHLFFYVKLVSIYVSYMLIFSFFFFFFFLRVSGRTSECPLFFIFFFVFFFPLKARHQWGELEHTVHFPPTDFTISRSSEYTYMYIYKLYLGGRVRQRQ